jgi:hypothetical protein
VRPPVDGIVPWYFCIRKTQYVQFAMSGLLSCFAAENLASPAESFEMLITNP